MSLSRVLVTGGAGFIGSAVVRQYLGETEVEVLNLDCLTYAANPASLPGAAGHPRYRFVQADICDRAAVADAVRTHRPEAILHLAAESHVDRSIDGPGAFVSTNVVGTYTLLEVTLDHWRGLDATARARFRFHHVSTDEVFGSLGATGAFTEASPYQPRSPYSATKAASDHLVRAWHETYGLPVVVTNCSNNYGPFHFPEKLIPLMILKALAREPLPVYGRGDNVRDWLFVEDHARALRLVAEAGAVGETYIIGGQAERTNLAVVEAICDLVDQLAPDDGPPRRTLISFVADRPGHDFRYAMDPTKIERTLGWRPLETFETGLRRTVAWYLENRWWWEPILAGRYQGERLGRATAAAGGGR